SRLFAVSRIATSVNPYFRMSERIVLSQGAYVRRLTLESGQSGTPVAPVEARPGEPQTATYPREPTLEPGPGRTLAGLRPSPPAPALLTARRPPSARTCGCDPEPRTAGPGRRPRPAPRRTRRPRPGAGRTRRSRPAPEASPTDPTPAGATPSD